MADRLKDIYSTNFLIGFGNKVTRVYPGFKSAEFLTAVLDDTWEDLSVRARSKQIATQLGYFLPANYETALEILFQLTDTCSGFAYLFFPDFVTIYGQEEADWERSMLALETFTIASTSEFAIRPFLLRDSKRTMDQLMSWATHPNEHIRRLASEGCRPRLPWAEALPLFKDNPEPVLALLELLKADPSLYVRKSVANNLNDISKDHPATVLQVAADWLGSNEQTNWIVRRACRTMIKEAHPVAMQLFGYAVNETAISDAKIAPTSKMLTIGENCDIHYTVTICPEQTTQLRLEYGIDFIKANGKTSRKKFLLSDKTLVGKTILAGTRTHKWANLTTRRHYPGKHAIVLLVNGIEVAWTEIELH
jgi:3-methyladenine DNA glycosylase AlkC